MERDMTSGNPGRILLNFTLPVFVGNVFQQFYSMVDTVVVGKFCRNQCTGRRWSHRNHQLSDHRIFNGDEYRIYCPYLPAFWGGRYEKECGKP